VRVSVVLDSVDPHAIAGFWQEALGYRLAADLGTFLVLAPVEREAPGQPVVILQRVGEPPAGKNRMHVDVHPPDARAHVAHLESLGGARVGPPVTELLDSHGVWWQSMTDPQGNVICVVADPPS
jgi:predicted enzyme related to lactoylglutathione lyase